MPRSGRLLALACSAAVLSAAPALALESGQISINGAVASHASLGAAIASASEGDRIEIGSGTYEGALDIAVAVTITGIDTGGGLPTIDGGKSRTAITISGEGVTLESLHVTTSEAAPHPFGLFQSLSEEGCIVIRGSGATVRDSFLDTCHYGVYVVGATEVEIADNSIEKNHFGGVFIRNSQRVKVTGNRLHSNGYSGIDVGTFEIPPGAVEAWRNLAPGVVLTEDPAGFENSISQYVEIQRNSVVGHGLGGIGIGYARYVAVIDNVVTDNGGWPMPQSFPPVARSTTDGVEGYGIALNCSTNQDIVQANTVTNNDNIGILLDGAFHVRVEDNEVSGSEHGIVLYGAYSNGLLTNRVFDNSGTGIRIERGAAFNPPPVGNLVTGNDLTGNRQNAWDTTGSDITPASGTDLVHQDLPADLTQPNRWDSGSEGNHFSDFDEPPEGFTDADGDGISEAPHPIPGGLAVDNHPLSAGRVADAAALVTVPDVPVQVAALGCSPCGLAAALAACPVQ